ncbi:hypothetical protein QAD02_006711 [Eretmocerus hayati]|uniref:Uncharacterized protein n=1 Tax=Eretmocerus hayati TaxID=131215 RepID=A0ACC2N1M1_9HYME|nr:hypothetical protein QAD02_006711 [Eretmocerus hayati]
MAAEVIGLTKLIVKGYVYNKHSTDKNRTWWACVRYGKDGKNSCRARATTSNINTTPYEDVKLYRGPDISIHNHLPIPEDVERANKCRAKKSPSPNLKRQSPSPEQNTSCEQVDPDRINFMRDPVRYRKFLLKFTEDPSFDRESIIRALDAVSNLGVSRTAACALVQSNRSKITVDLDVLSSNIITASSSSHSKTNSTQVDDQASHSSVTPKVKPQIEQSASQATTTKDVQDTNTHPPVKKKGKKDNAQMMELLTTTIESTIETMQHITELMQANKDKKDKKKRKKEREEKRRVKKLKIRIIPPVPNSIPIRSLSSPDSVCTSIASPVKDFKDEFPVIDLTVEEDTKLRNVCGIPSDFRVEPTRPQPSCVYNASAVLIPDSLNASSSNPLMNGGAMANSYLQDKPNVTPTVVQDFFYNPVTIQQLNFGAQYPSWDFNNVQTPLQSLRGMANSFVTDMGQFRPFSSMRQPLPISHDARRT